MQSEIEAKYLGVDHDIIRAELKKQGAVCVQQLRITKRINFDYPDRRLHKNRHAWLRLRDEGDKVTLAYKQLNDRSLQGMKEVQIVVDDYNSASELIRATGLVQVAYQEVKRESWELDGVQIELDEWPWVRPFAEVEARTEEEVWRISKLLGLDVESALYGSVEIVYQKEYDVTEDEVDSWETITFTPVPEWLLKKRRVIT